MFDTPDIPTLRLCSMLASFAFAVMMLTLWWGRRGTPALLFWAASAASYAFVIFGFEWVGGVPGPAAGFALFSLLAGSDAMLLWGVDRFEGRNRIRPWTIAVSAAAGLGYAIPFIVLGPGSALPASLGTAGLLAVKSAVGIGLLPTSGSLARRGRRIAGLALLGYLPAYAFGIAQTIGGFRGPDLTAMIPMLADQLLLAALNIGLLSMLVEQATGDLRDAALTDPLTGSWNRAWLDANRIRLTRPGTGLILLDFDHFKTVNDVHGHHVGDRLLIGFAATVRAALPGGRGGLVRLGGDEFLVALSDTTPAAVETFAIRLLDDWRRSDDSGCTLSAGYTTIDEADVDLSTALARADRSLYRAKALGRNQVAA